jgi:hypothetical protein
MDKRTFWILFLIVVMSLLLISAAPTPLQAANAKSTNVRLTIINNTNDYVTLKLEGPQFYYFWVKPGETREYTPLRGMYTSRFYSCGVFVNGTFDLTKIQKLIVPACGTKAIKGPDKNHVIDAGKLTKFVKVTFENDTPGWLTILLSGPNKYEVILAKDQVTTIVMMKGEYNYRLYACGSIKDGHLYAMPNKVKTLTCP